jgi:mycofactocin precursor
MSQTETESVEKSVDEDSPEIEEDIVKEELRIDGICGVY